MNAASMTKAQDVLDRVRGLSEGRILKDPTRIHANYRENNLRELAAIRVKGSRLTWQQKRIVAIALQSEAASVCELSDWSGCEPFTILSIAQQPIDV